MMIWGKNEGKNFVKFLQSLDILISQELNSIFFPEIEF